VRRLALTLPLVAVAALAARASAEAPAKRGTESAEHHFRLLLPAAWQPVTPAPGPEQIVASYTNPATDQVLAITRANFPNIPAWRKKQAFFTAVEAGFAEASDDYRRLHLRRRHLGRVPVMDLRFERQRAGQRETAFVRLLFFRTYSLTLTVVSPGRLARRQSREVGKITDAFRPFFGK